MLLGLLATLCLAPALAAEGQPLRRLTITIAVDAAQERKPDWLNAFRSAVSAVSAAYEKNFGIAWEIGEVVRWQASGKDFSSTDAVLQFLASDVPRGSGDVLVGLYGERCIDTFAGKAVLFQGQVVLMTACANKLPAWVSDKAVLSHELAHVFGAFHVRSHIQSVMNGDSHDVFDRQTREVIGLTRDLDFKKAENTIRDLDVARRKALTAIYDQGHAKDSVNPVAQSLQVSAEVFARRSEWETAVQLSREALAIDSHDWPAYRVFGGWHHAQGRYDEALKSFRQALEYAPNDPISLAGVAAALAAQGKSSESIAVYSKAAEHGGDWVVAKHNRAVLYIQQGKLAEAERDLREVVKNAPEAMDAYINLAAALGLQKKLDESVSVLQQALKRDPNYQSAHANLGYTYALMGRLDEAIVEYRKALALQPSDARTKVNLNNAMAQQSKNQRAQKGGN